MMPDWFPDHPPIYDINKTYAENAAEGPFFNGKIPNRPKSEKRFDFLGHKVNSLIGVPSGPLLNSNWIALAAKLGFDVVAYKTIRSEAYPSHGLPNVVFVDGTGKRVKEPKTVAEITITNSFGNPSRSPDFLLQDIERGNQSLGKGQVMIVSVYGESRQGISVGDDFVRAAAMAREAGAKIIEANFSCPNIVTGEGILYNSPETVHEYAKAIVKAIHPAPLILKVGVFPSFHLMQSVFLAAARAGVRAICGINTLSRTITPPLSSNRTTGGICGAAIRPAALSFIRDAAQIIQKNKLDFELIACGGIMLPEHFDEFFEAGAQVAMSATGMMWDPYLAMRYHHAHSLSHS